MRAARAAAPIALALLAAAALTFLRAGVAGTIRVDNLPSTIAFKIWPALIFGALAAVAGRRYLAALSDPPQSFRALLAGAIAIHLCAAPSLPFTSNDLFSNLAYGRLSALGFDPYLTTPLSLPAGDAFAALVGARWAGTPIVYGPILAAVNALAGAVSAHSVIPSLILLKALTLAASLAAVMLAWWCARSRDDAAGFVLFGFCPLVAWELSGQAHNDAFMVLAMVAFAWAAVAEREWIAVIALALALFAKLAVAPILVLYLAYVARRSPVKALALAILVAAIGAALIAPYWHGLATLRGPLQTAGADASRTSRSFADLLYLAATPLGARAQKIVFAICYGAGGLVMAALGLRALLRANTVDKVIRHGLLLFLAYFLVAAPWFQPWYATWLLPLALVERDARWRHLVALYAALTLAQYILPIDPLTTVAVNLVVLRRLWPLARETT
jgi:hypothetical protein